MIAIPRIDTWCHHREAGARDMAEEHKCRRAHAVLATTACARRTLQGLTLGMKLNAEDNLGLRATVEQGLHGTPVIQAIKFDAPHLKQMAQYRE